ncbi:MAG: hypothetical protein KC583_15075 [Myxococcales bacterium]|nr:hypothetical protein [Myxococcales bacterium]
MDTKTRRITLTVALLAPLAVALGLRAIDADLTGRAIGEGDAVIGLELSGINHAWTATGLDAAFHDAPTFAQIVTDAGQDPANVRLDRGGNLRIQELTGDDVHAVETVDVLVLAGDLAAQGIDGESGTVRVNQADRAARHTVQLERAYDDPVVLLQVGSYAGVQPVEAQVYAADATSFTFALVEPPNIDGAHAREYVHYAVIDAGNYTLADGRRLVAGKVQNGLSDFAPGQDYTKVPTAGWFSGPVTSITRVQSSHTDEFASTWALEVTASNGDQTKLKTRFKRAEHYTDAPNSAFGVIGYVLLGAPGEPGSLLLTDTRGDQASLAYESDSNGRCYALTDLGLGERDLTTIELKGRAFGRTSVVLYSGEHCTGGEASLSATAGATETASNIWPEDAAGQRVGDNGAFASLRVLWSESASLSDERCFAGGQVVLTNDIGYLVFQDDGDLVLYRYNATDDTFFAAWSSQTAGQAEGGSVCTELVSEALTLNIRDAAGDLVWSAEGASNFGDEAQALELRDDCDLALVPAPGSPLTAWSAGTADCWTNMPPAVQSAMPDFVLAFTDIDGDGANELVLLTTYADGTTFLMFDPLGIAQMLDRMGITIDDYYFETLSPTQQAAAEQQTASERSVTGASTSEALVALAGSSAGGRYVSIEMERTAYEAGTQSNGSSVSVTVGHYAYESEPGVLGENVEMEAYVARVEGSTANGNVSASVTVGQASQTQYIGKDGFAVGGGFDAVAAGVVFGDTEGSYVGFSASVGTSGGVEARWGRDDQYGFTVDVPKFPVGIAIYVSGSDVTWLGEEIADLAVAGYDETSDAAVYAWGWTADKAPQLAAGTKVFFTTAATDTRIAITRATDAVEGGFWTSVDATTEFFVSTGNSAWKITVSGFDDTYESIELAVAVSLEELEDSAAAVTAAFANAVQFVDSSAQVVADTAAGVYDAVSGGATNAAKRVVKAFKKLF